MSKKNLSAEELADKAIKSEARKQLVKSLALQAGVVIGSAALTAVTSYHVNKALTKNADPMKVYVTNDYTVPTAE